MVYTEDLKPCHELSREGRLAYEKMLEQRADEILFKHNHPLKWLVLKTKEIFN